MELDLLNLFLLLLAAWLAGNIAERFRYPSVLGELLAGILLGPPLLGLLHGTEGVAVLAEIGVLTMMLYIGMEIDPRELGKASWAGLLAAIGGFVTPFVLAYFVVVGFGGTTMAGLFVGIAAGVTSLATKSRILADLQILDTRIAHVLMAGALVSDTLALLAFAAIMGVVDAGGLDLQGVAVAGAKALAFFAVTMAAGIKLFPAAGRRMTEMGLTSRTFHFTLVVLLAVAFGELAELAGLHSILGAFIAGLFLRENVLGRSLSHDLMEAVREVSIGFLAPIFFITAGFEVSFGVFTGTDLGLFLAILGVAIVGKIVGTALFYLPTGFGWREGITVGAGMNGRGAVEIIVAGIGLEQGLISAEIFSILVFMAIFTTATVPLLLRWGTDWLRDRDELVRTREDRSGTLVVGAGPLARTLAQLLADGGPVRIVDSNPGRCQRAERMGLSTVCGNALQEQVLAEAGAGGVETLVAATSNGEVNALVARLAGDVFGIPHIHVLQRHAEPIEREAALSHLEASLLFGRSIDLDEWDHRAARDGLETVEMPLPEARRLDARGLLEELARTEDDAIAAAVSREDGWVPFHSGTRLRGGRLLVLRPRRPERDRFDELVAGCPVLDLEGPLEAEAFFREAADRLADVLGMDPARLTAGLRDREKASSTVLAPGVAVPHIRLPGSDRFEILLARCRRGVAFPGQPEPVRAIFVLASSDDQRALHLRALSAIAQVAQPVAFEERWRSAEDAAALRQLVLEAPRPRVRSP